MECYRSLAFACIGREDVARTFVLYAVGTNTDKRFAHVYPREELPSFAIGLLKNIVTTATGVEIVKKREISTLVLFWYDFLDKVD